MRAESVSAKFRGTDFTLDGRRGGEAAPASMPQDREVKSLMDGGNSSQTK